MTEQALETARAWRRANPEKVRASKHAYYLRHKEEILAARRRYRKTKGYVKVRRARELMQKYGISLGEYEKLLKKQKRRCAICRRKKPYGRWGRFFVVDHCHRKKRVRGLLCNSCNRALGYLGDSVKLFLRAAKYLRRSPRPRRSR